MEEYNPRLKKMVIEVVENQMRDNDPPVTNITYDRLVKSGYTKQQAKEKIAAVVAENIFYIMHDGQDFNLAQYEQALNSIQ